MTGKWCSYCEDETPMQVAVVIEICTDLDCIHTGHHNHGASRTEDKCGTCGMPTKITDSPHRSHP